MWKNLVIKYSADLLLWMLAGILAFWLRVEDPLPRFAQTIPIYLLLTLPLKALLIFLFNFYRQSWRKVGVRDLFSLMKGVGIAVAVTFPTAFFALYGNIPMPRSVPIIEGLVAILLMGGARLATRLWYERALSSKSDKDAQRVLIIGAGDAGTSLARELIRHPESKLNPIGFLDDDAGKDRQTFVGLPVLGKIEDLSRVVSEIRADQVLIAIPSAPGQVIRRVVELAQKAKVSYRTMPSLYDIVSGKVSITQIREVALEDLLRRKPVRLDIESIAGYLENRVVLVTGAGGSIGSEIVRQVCRFKPRRLILFGRGENSIYQIERELERNHPEITYVSIIGNVQNREKLRAAFEEYRPQVVFHVAAHKHVPLMEHNPDEAILNNVGGTKNVAELALEYGVERMVNISTDKAVNPTSVMGASKRAAEYVVESVARRAAPGQAFVSVRFGNVLGSRGSVVPLFKQQISLGGPVTVTHPDMTRYFMTIPEAAQLVLQAGGLGDNGSVYVLDMGEPVKIVDLARDLIRLSGFEPDVDIEIKFNGIRPGEKLFEEILTTEEGTIASRHEKIFIARQTSFPSEHFDFLLDHLFEVAEKRDGLAIRGALMEMIPTYHPELIVQG
jgi:FlaA1/EpsC-like NDP-sugar epimerase